MKQSPMGLLWWLIRCQPWRAVAGTLLGTVWMASLMGPPYVVSQVIDRGLRPGDQGAVLAWTGVLLGTTVASAAIGIVRHRTMTKLRMTASFDTARLVGRQVTRLGASLPSRVSAGEVVHIGVADIVPISNSLTIVGPGIGGLVTYAVVVVLLFGLSPLLGVVVLLGMPAIVATFLPLLRRLQRAEAGYRTRQGELTTRVGDIVSGLRVLRGIGGGERFAAKFGERSRTLLDDGYRVGSVTSWVQALTSGVPIVYTAVVIWLAARMTITGELTVGEMVAVYGYVSTLIVPLWFVITGGDDLARGLVAAGRVVNLLKLEPGNSPDGTPGPESTAELHDPDSGVRVPPGSAMALVSARPAESAAVIDRLGRYTDSAATWGGKPLLDIELAEIRRRILVAENEAHLFAGPLRGSLVTRVPADDATVRAAVHTAVAEDIVDGLPDGLESFVEARGNNLSGGQRQRLRLARALLAEPEVLLLVEPASAVDAPTETLIAERLRKHRTGRTTVVATTSPALADQADTVLFLVDGAVAATGTHTELLHREPGYRQLVFRGAETEAVR